MMSGQRTDYEFLIGTLSSGGGPAARAAAGAAVRDWAAGTLRAVADGRRPLRAVIHPLGFTCLPVERAGRDGVCVHVWSPDAAAAPAAAAIHAHCWELTSYALAGELDNRLMTVTDALPAPVPPAGGGPLSARRANAAADAPAGAVYQVLRVRSQGDVDELSPTPRLVRCREARRQRVAAGDTYGVPAGVFHATDVPPQGEAVTVALGRMVGGVADLSLAPAAPADPATPATPADPAAPLATAGHQVRRRRCDPAQTAATARFALDRLQVALAR